MMAYRSSPLTKPKLECYPVPLSGNDFQRNDSSDDIDSDDFYGDDSNNRRQYMLISKLNANLQHSHSGRSETNHLNRNAAIVNAISQSSPSSSAASNHCIKCTTAQNGIRKCQGKQYPLCSHPHQHHHHHTHLHDSPKFGYFVPIPIDSNQHFEQKEQSLFENGQLRTVKARHRRRSRR